MDVSSVTHAFAPLRLDIIRDADENGEGLTVKGWETFRGNEWGNKGEDMVRVVGKGGVEGGKMVEVRCLGWKGFYLERSKCEYKPNSHLRKEIRRGGGGEGTYVERNMMMVGSERRMCVC